MIKQNSIKKEYKNKIKECATCIPSAVYDVCIKDNDIKSAVLYSVLTFPIAMLGFAISSSIAFVMTAFYPIVAIASDMIDKHSENVFVNESEERKPEISSYDEETQNPQQYNTIEKYSVVNDYVKSQDNDLER